MPEALAGHPGLVLTRRATRSFEALDFTVLGPGERLAQIELKAKHQPYRGWAQLAEDRPEYRVSSSFLRSRSDVVLPVAGRPTGLVGKVTDRRSWRSVDSLGWVGKVACRTVALGKVWPAPGLTSYNQNLWINHPFEGAAYLPR